MSKYPHIGILTTAEGFIEAANRLNDGPQWTAATMPVYYLYFHAIELCLKSFLCSKDVSDNELRKIGHDLMQCWNRAEKLGICELLPEYQELIGCLKVINPLYTGKELEYYMAGLKSVPQIKHVEKSANLLYSKLDGHYRHALKKTRNKSVQPTADAAAD